MGSKCSYATARREVAGGARRPSSTSRPTTAWATAAGATAALSHATQRSSPLGQAEPVEWQGAQGAALASAATLPYDACA